MHFAGRMNSFILKGDCDIYQAIDKYHTVKGITHLEFNYPEHIAPYPMEELLRHVGDMEVNGISTRFSKHFAAGEFTNADESISREAVQMCTSAVDACRSLGGKVVTIWLGFDGFDYSFQSDYEKKWNTIIRSFREIADYAQDIRISIEYKPFEPRTYSLIDSIGLTMMAIQEIDRPNVGVTLDFCHMLMKHENPAYSLTFAARRGKLFGLHMNDGFRMMDDGLIFASVNLPQALEFVYYLKKYKYNGVVFFDSFPVREDAAEEIQTNIETFRSMSDAIDRVGMDRISRVIDRQDGVSSQKLVLELLKSNV
jgi:xylose isomerase